MGKTPKNSKPASVPRLEKLSNCQLDNMQKLEGENSSTHHLTTFGMEKENK